MMLEKPYFPKALETHQELLSAWGLTSDQVSKLGDYLTRLWAANQEMNLFSRKLSPQSLVVDHLLDCLIALPRFPPSRCAADLGSGGGMPGIPLAIARPDCEFHLFEKSPKKQRFLVSLADCVPNTVVHGAIEPDSLTGKFDWVTARAFKPIPVILDLTRRFAANHGRYLLYKGRRAVIEAELKAAKCRPDQATLHRLDPIGEAEERYLVSIQKP